MNAIVNAVAIQVMKLEIFKYEIIATLKAMSGGKRIVFECIEFVNWY